MKRLLLTIVLLLNLNFIMNDTAYAEETSEKSAGGYTIEGIPNSHQIDPDSGYFDLAESPGEKDQLKIKIVNESNHEKKMSITVTNGNTNSNGLVDYTGELKDHSSLINPLKSILKATEDTVIVSPNSEKEVILDLTMPEEQFDGIILGGIQFSDITNASDKNQKTSIENKYVYTLGVVIKNDPKTETYKNISVVLEDVQSKLSYGRKIVQANLLNENPYILGKATVEGTIVDEKTNKIVQEQQKENVSIAPHSIYPFQFDWKKEEIKPGNYIFKGKAETKDNKWEFTKKFTITKKQANTLNKNTVFKVSIPYWLQICSVVFSMLMVISSGWLIYRKHKRGVS
ncbi:DUF916 and DUF3324 domain-containing protein [Candidatus Enterococcus avicola]